MTAQCEASTTQARRCRLRAIPGAGRCHLHHVPAASVLDVDLRQPEPRPRYAHLGGLAKLETDARHDAVASLVLADQYEEMGDPRAAVHREGHRLYRAAVAESSLGRLDAARLERDELPPVSVPRRKRVEAMTEAESAQMASWAERWIKIGLSTEPADRPRFEAAVRACYRHTLVDGKPLDDNVRVIWVRSPLECVLVGSLLTLTIKDLRVSVRDSVGASVRASVRDSVGASVGASVRDSVGASVGDSVRDSVGASVGDSVGASVGDSVRDSVGASVGDSVGDSVGASVGDSVRDSVPIRLSAVEKTAVRANWHRYQGGQFWAGWWWGPAYVSFMLDVLGLQPSESIELRARAYAATAESACWWWPGRGYVVVSERPHTIELNGDGRLVRAAWRGFEVRP